MQSICWLCDFFVFIFPIMTSLCLWNSICALGFVRLFALLMLVAICYNWKTFSLTHSKRAKYFMVKWCVHGVGCPASTIRNAPILSLDKIFIVLWFSKVIKKRTQIQGIFDWFQCSNKFGLCRWYCYGVLERFFVYHCCSCHHVQDARECLCWEYDTQSLLTNPYMDEIWIVQSG